MRVRLPTTRIATIDAFRGITIFTMIFVNELAGVTGIPSWMKHADADADAMTFVDVVFPAFLFIVGMSIPFSVQQHTSKADTTPGVMAHIVMRALALMVMGVFMVNAEGDYNEAAMGVSIHVWTLLFISGVFLVWFDYKTPRKPIASVPRAIGVLLLVMLAVLYKDEGGDAISPRWWGILGLIGWAYLIGSGLYLMLRANRLFLVILLLLCLGYYTLGHFAFPQNPFHRHPLFSQGGHAVHTAIVLAGTVLSLIFYKVDLLVERRHRYANAMWLGVGILLLGFSLRPLMGVSKIYATPSWAAFSIAICITMFILLYVLVEHLRVDRWTALLKPSAAQPLLVYILPYIVYAAMKTLGVSFPGFLYQGAVGVIWALGYAAIILLIGWLLMRRGIRLRL